MIFITLGTQKFQFNRILKKIDELVSESKINEQVFAQIGYSDYTPKHYDYKKFIDRDEFQQQMKKSNIVITHGGTGTIITAVKNEKKVIAVPRLKEYGEHVDNHQLQILEEFENIGIIKAAYNMDELEKTLANKNQLITKKYKSNTQNIIKDIENYLNM